MSTNPYDTLQLVGRHVPDDNSGPFNNMQDAMAAGHDTINPTTGVYQIGVLVGGAFVTLLEEPAARFYNLVDVAKAAQPAPAESSDSSSVQQSQ